MDLEKVQRHRRERLQAAVERIGSKAELGRKLGYVDGSFVGQMLRAERPVTEETVAAIENLRGMAGWFSPQTEAATWPFELVDQAKWERLTEQERGYVQAATNRAIGECEQRRTGLPAVAATIVTPVTKDHGRRTTSTRWKKVPVARKRGGE